jgi:fibronectin type 3 domain-containing protein
MSSGILVGTFNKPYTDESIDFDLIGEVELNANEQGQPNSPCKFSYNFSFTPEDGVDYYIMTLPCDDTVGYANVSLAADGRAYFNATYNETTKICNITQTYVLSD